MYISVANERTMTFLVHYTSCFIFKTFFVILNALLLLLLLLLRGVHTAYDVVRRWMRRDVRRRTWSYDVVRRRTTTYVLCMRGRSNRTCAKYRRHSHYTRRHTTSYVQKCTEIEQVSISVFHVFVSCHDSRTTSREV